MQKLIIKYILLPLLLAAFPMSGSAQYFESGQDPAAIRWEQLHTRHFRIIYPLSYKEEAQRLANLLEHAYELVSGGLEHKPAKIPVVVHNYSARSNGFVAWAPKRMELFPAPSPNSWPQESLEQLVLHELRHVVQIDKLNQGFTKGLSILLGQQAVGALSAMLPLWFLEGDAVNTETMLSNSGRGKLPSFEMELKAMSLEQGKVFKYDKMVFGSYLDNIPSYYHSGYQIVNHSMEEYGELLWSNALETTGRKPFLLNPVNFSLKKQTGLTKKKVFMKSFSALHEKWEEEDREQYHTNYPAINKEAVKDYTSYRFAQYVSDSSIIVEKSGPDQLNQLVITDLQGNEKALFTPGFYQPLGFSYARGFVVWAEHIPDPRWENRSYSVVKKLDIRSGKETSLGKRTRYYSPTLSPDASMIACIDISLDDISSLCILDALSGEKISSLSLPGINSLHMPQWKDTGKIIVLMVDSRGKSIMELELSSGKWKELLPWGYRDIQKAIAWKEYIIYHSTYSGTDNIYACNTSTGKISGITSSRFGARFPAISPSGEKLVFSNYSSTGYNISEIELDPKQWEAVDIQEPLPQQPAIFNAADIEEREYETKPFRKTLNLFSFHSWMPFYFDYENFSIDELPVSAGVTLISQNELSTATSSLGLAWTNNELSMKSSFIFKGWYPIIDLGHSYGGKPYIRKPEDVEEPAEYLPRSQFSSSIYIPFNLTQSKIVKGFVPRINLSYNNSYNYNEASGTFEKGELFTSGNLYYYSYLKTSLRDIKPRLGLTVNLYYRSAPFNEEIFGRSAFVHTGFYLPGPFKHHSLYLQGGMEKQRTEKYLYYNNLPLPRGYYNYIAEDLNILKADYYLPLYYPELNLGSLLYVPRIYLDIFGDLAMAENVMDEETRERFPGPKYFSSTGVRVVTDFFLLRLPFPLNFGVRLAYIPEFGSTDIDISFGVNFSGFQINSRHGKGIFH